MSSRAPLSNSAGEATHLGKIGKTVDDVPLGAATLGERLKTLSAGKLPRCCTDLTLSCSSRPGLACAIAQAPGSSHSMKIEPKSEAHLVTVADGVHAWIGAGGDSNAGAIETPEGVIVVDTQQYPRLARQLRAAVLARTGKPLRAVVNTHGHLDHTSGNTVFADVPILSHWKALAAMEACLGPRHGETWSISDFGTKLRLLFGHNIFELVPEGDPARRWFEGRIGLPDYDTVVIRAPNETFSDHFAFHLPDETVHLTYFGPAHSEGPSSCILNGAGSYFLAISCSTVAFPGSVTATWTASSPYSAVFSRSTSGWWYRVMGSRRRSPTLRNSATCFSSCAGRSPPPSRRVTLKRRPCEK